MMIAAQLQSEIRDAPVPAEETLAIPSRGGASPAVYPLGLIVADEDAGDGELAAAVARALQSNRRIPPDQIRVEVRNGWVTLEGEVEWLYERFEAHETVSHLKGITGCSTRISVTPHPAHLTGR